MFVLSTNTSASLSTGVARIDSVVLVGGSANSSVILYDNTAGSGTAKVELKALANDSKTFVPKSDITFDTGVYATLSGTGAKVYVFYK